MTNLVANPFVKQRNLKWEIKQPSSLAESQVNIAADSESTSRVQTQAISTLLTASEDHSNVSAQASTSEGVISSAAVEAGKEVVQDRLQYFSTRLAQVTRITAPGPRLSIPDFKSLYETNVAPHGHHFVVHQHDHPIAGLHYDLRLQISETSSISFAIMYGLPGNPNSRRLNRNATETRVHNLWNHLIETASASTGSLLIWDTGKYEVLPRRSKYAPKVDPESASSDSETSDDHNPALAEPQKLATAFQNRKIKLRLHGTRLPQNYTLSLRLTKSENRHEQPRKPVRKRRRTGVATRGRRKRQETSSISASDSEEACHHSSPALRNTGPGNSAAKTAYDTEIQELEDEEVRRTNAYPGAMNTIGSIHQRRWYLSIDRISSGFWRESGSATPWKRVERNGALDGFEPFFVKGSSEERSVVTGRLASEVMADEGVIGYVGRKGWWPVLE